MARKLKTDFEILNKLAAVDDEMFAILENVDKKYKFNRKQFILDALCEAETMLLDSLYTPPLNKEMFGEKIFLLARSQSRLILAEYQFYRLNSNNNGVSNKALSRLMDGIYSLHGDYDRLLSSLRKKYESDASGCARGAELGMIRTADCNKEGGSNV